MISEQNYPKIPFFYLLCVYIIPQIFKTSQLGDFEKLVQEVLRRFCPDISEAVA